MNRFFYFQLCLDNYVRECELSPFNELCLLSNVLRNKDIGTITLYTNRPFKFKTFTKLSEYIEINPVNSEILSKALDDLKEAKKKYKPAHLSDILRFTYLYEYGGVYLDTDILVLKSFQPLLGMPHDLILASESKQKINNGLIIANKPGVELFKNVLQNYEDDYRPDQWIYNSMIYLNAMVKWNSGANSIRVLEPEAGFHYPRHDQLAELFKSVDFGKSTFTENYSHHICGSIAPKGQTVRAYITDRILSPPLCDKRIYLDNLIDSLLIEYEAL
jgi:hypothetical protein